MENQLVFMPNSINSEPYTYSSIIADYAGIKHHSVQQLIMKHESDISDFGTVAFEMRACPHKTGSSFEKLYRLNEQQATLLISYMKNTDPVRRFKKALVKDFYAMKKELFNRRTNREMLKSTHKNLTEAIKLIPENERSAHDYQNYNSLAYIVLFGCSAAKLKKQRGADKKAKAIDYLTSDEYEQLKCIKDKICICIEIGMRYPEIKARLMQTYNKTEEVKND